MSPASTTAEARPWHAVAAADAFDRLSSSPEGLSAEDAARRLGRYGPHDLTRRRGRSVGTVLAGQFTSPLIYALLASAAVAYVLGEVADGTVVLGVVVLNAAIGFVQEFRAGRAIEGLARLVPAVAVVIRASARCAHAVRHRGLTPTQWVQAAAAGAVVLPAVAGEKWWRRRSRTTPPA